MKKNLHRNSYCHKYCHNWFRAIFGYSWNTFSDQIKAYLNSNPIIQNHISYVTEIEIDLAATGNEINNDIFVFAVEGSKTLVFLKWKLIQALIYTFFQEP